MRDIAARVREVLTASTVFGDPVVHDGVTVIPVTKISGGGGGGSGTDADTDNSGFGGGMGFGSRPVGVYVLRDGEVTWKPAVDVNRTITTAAAVLVVAMATVRSIVRRRRRFRAGT